MLSIEFTREDMYPWCRKLNFKRIRLNEHIDIERLRKEGKIKNHDIVKADLIYFKDDDGSNKTLREK